MISELRNWLGLSMEETLDQSGTASGSLTKLAQATEGSKPPASVAPPVPVATPAPVAPAPAAEIRGSGKYLTFEQRPVTFDDIYDNASVKPVRMSYNILKVAEMVNSPHLTGLSPDTKRASLLMALEAAGAEVEDLLQDAVVRQRALNDFEAEEQTRLREFEAGKAEENRKLQALIQANLDEVSRAQDSFRAWQKRKQQEAHRISEAAAFCVPQNNTAAGNLTQVLERAVAFGR